MAYLFRKKLIRWYYQGRRISAKQARRLQARGKSVEKREEETRKWYIRYRDGSGHLREVPGFTDKDATLAKAAELERDAEREQAGLVRPSEKFASQPVEVALREFEACLRAKGRTAKHVKHVLTRVRRVFSQAGIVRLADISAAKVRDVLANLGLSLQTRNHYLAQCKSFTRWLWREGRLPDDPLAALSRWNAEVDRRVNRRPLAPDELARLIRTAEASTDSFRGLSGPDRAALYALAAGSGLRASELASLRRVDLDLDADPPTVKVRAAYAKNRREDVIPLPPEVADYLRNWLAGRPTIPTPETPLWSGSWAGKAAKMLWADLKAAGIEPEGSNGRVDFHALRSTYATFLARVGVNLQTAQALLRHSDPKLTAKTYTKLGISDLGKVVSGLRLGFGEGAGTSGQAVDE